MDRPSPHRREERRLIDRRQQGDLGEASAIEWFTGLGATVWAPLGHSPDADLIAALDGRLLRIQVKTCTYLRDARWCAQLATCGGNQSWNGTVKHLDPSRYDLLFVLVGDGRRWCIPSYAVESTTRLLLGGPKYSEFEVEGGGPIVVNPPLESSSPTRGSAGVGEPGRPVKSVPKLLSEFESHLPHHQSELLAGPSARTRVSANHQITIPLGPFHGAELDIGQAIRVTAAGDGQLLLERIEARGAAPTPGETPLAGESLNPGGPAGS
jgi:hypothetical protein